MESLDCDLQVVLSADETQAPCSIEKLGHVVQARENAPAKISELDIKGSGTGLCSLSHGFLITTYNASVVH